MEPGVLLIPVLIAVSGAIALVGNAVGRGIGRRRLTLFGLRPRYTAQVITVATGIVIAVVTLVIVLLLSNEARVALFRLNEVLLETRRLEAEIGRQQDRLKELALGDIAYLNNQEVVRDIIDGRQPSDVLRHRVDVLADRAAEIARENGIGADVGGSTIVLTPPRATWETIADLIDQRDTNVVLRLVANQNTLKGEPLTVFVQMFANQPVYPTGTVLIAGDVDGRQSREEIGRELLRLADRTAHLARGKVLSAPFTLVTAAPNATADIDDLRATVTRIRRVGGPATVQVVAAQDVYTVGPLAVSFKVVTP